MRQSQMCFLVCCQRSRKPFHFYEWPPGVPTSAATRDSLVHQDQPTSPSRGRGTGSPHVSPFLTRSSTAVRAQCCSFCLSAQTFAQWKLNITEQDQLYFSLTRVLMMQTNCWAWFMLLKCYEFIWRRMHCVCNVAIYKSRCIWSLNAMKNPWHHSMNAFEAYA